MSRGTSPYHDIRMIHRDIKTSNIRRISTRTTLIYIDSDLATSAPVGASLIACIPPSARGGDCVFRARELGRSTSTTALKKKAGTNSSTAFNKKKESMADSDDDDYGASVVIAGITTPHMGGI